MKTCIKLQKDFMEFHVSTTWESAIRLLLSPHCRPWPKPRPPRTRRTRRTKEIQQKRDDIIRHKAASESKQELKRMIKFIAKKLTKGKVDTVFAITPVLLEQERNSLLRELHSRGFHAVILPGTFILGCHPQDASIWNIDKDEAYHTEVLQIHLASTTPKIKENEAKQES